MAERSHRRWCGLKLPIFISASRGPVAVSVGGMDIEQTWIICWFYNPLYVIQYKIYIILVILDWFCWPTLFICPKMSNFMLETHVLSTIMTCRLHICPQEFWLRGETRVEPGWVHTVGRSVWIWMCVFFQQNAMVIKWHFHVFSWDDLYWPIKWVDYLVLSG